MLRSLWEVEREGGALVPGRVLVARVPPGGPSGQLTPADAVRRTDRLLGEIEAIPGVRAAALWSVTFGYPARIQGLAPAGRNPTAMWFNVTSGYLAASGVSLLAGRWLTEGDRAASPPVVVVSERFARRFSAVLPDLDAIVGRTTFGPLVPAGSSAREAPVTIVGVVSDFRSGRLGILQPDASDALPQVFFPDALRPVAGGELLVRTSSSPLGLAPSIREVVSDRLGMRLTGVRTLDDQMSAAIAPRRFKSRLSVVFAAIALLLAAAGVSGVLRHAVARRTREIGVRVALGARASDIRRLFLAYAGGLVAVGVTLGLAGSVALSKVMAGLLYGIGPFDPVAYAGVSLLLAAAALGAAYAPARRAMRLDPAVVLRHQ
jgi:putative ABC transport system permease protein